jgi:exosortase A
MTAASPAADLARPRRHGLLAALPALLLGLLGWGLLFRAEIVAAVRVWTDSTAYNHGFFVLPIALWLAWDRRRAAAGLLPRPTAWPALAALPFGLAWFAADRLGLMEGRQFAALGLLEVLLVAWLGWRLARAFAAPLAYLVFLVPSGAFLVPWLQAFTARFIDVGLDLFGIPHVVTDFTIEIPEGTFYVAEACAGLRFLIASVAFGALYAILIYRSTGRRVLFLAAACVVPVLANGVRALGIVVLGHILGSAEAAVADHLIYGWGFFSVVILLLTAAGLPFRQDSPRPAAPAAAPAATLDPPRGGGAWWAAGAVLGLAAIGPAASWWLDRATPPPTLTLPAFAATAACRPAAPAGPDQRFDCGGAVIAARVVGLPAGSGPAALQAVLQAVTGERGADDVVRGSLTIDGIAPRRWRLTELRQPSRMTATAVFVDGAPAPGGLAGRLRLAWDSLGGGGPPVLVAASLEAPALADPQRREAGRRVLQDFLAAQGEVLAAARRASSAAARP